MEPKKDINYTLGVSGDLLMKTIKFVNVARRIQNLLKNIENRE